MLAAQIATLLLGVTSFTGSPDVVMIDFRADWCGPCRSMEPVVHQLAAAGYPIHEVNIDQDRALAAKFHVESIPCFVLIVNGHEVTRTVGANSPATLVGMFRQAGFDPVAGGMAAGGVASTNDAPRHFHNRGAGANSAPTFAGGDSAPSTPSSPTAITQPMPMAIDPALGGGPVAGSASANAPASMGTAWGENHPYCVVPPTMSTVAKGTDPSAQMTVASAATSAGTANESATASTADAPTAAGAPANISAESGDSLKARMLAACVRLKVSDSAGNSYGSGTIIDARNGEALILTCGHVFRDSDGTGPVLVDVFGPQGTHHVSGRLIACNLERDVGLVSIKVDFPLIAARLAPPNAAPQPGDRVTGIGCSGGANPTVQESHINSVGRFKGPPNLQVAGQPVQGRSGGGLFDSKGRVIGVCNAADPEDNEGLFAAQESIYKELDRAGLSFIYRGGIPSTVAVAPHESSAPPAMAGEMPLSSNSPPAHTTPASAKSTLTPEEVATLAELRDKARNAEVICIVRPTDPHAKSEIIVLDKASPAFLKQLGDSQADNPPAEPAARLTSLDVPDAATRR